MKNPGALCGVPKREVVSLSITHLSRSGFRDHLSSPLTTSCYLNNLWLLQFEGGGDFNLIDIVTREVRKQLLLILQKSILLGVSKKIVRADETAPYLIPAMRMRERLVA
jgi:hypothetical protein